MFQDFDETSDASESASRTERLRAALREAGVDGFLVPRADEHQGEYIAPSAARLAWLTGFTGSAGVALVLPDRAAIFVDGRYTTQVRAQVDTSVFTPESSVDTPLADYLKKNAPTARIGFDPWLHTAGEIAALKRSVEAAGGALVALKHNPVDRIWQDRPTPPKGPVRPHPERFAGRSSSDKLADLADTIRDAGAALAVLTDPSSVAWTFNIRGSDVPHTPLPLSFAILRKEGRPILFIDADKLGEEARAHLAALCELEPPDAFEKALARLSRNAAVMLDPALAADRLRAIVEEAEGRVVEKPDPARLPRARKNGTEIAGCRVAHRRDGAAVTRFLAWLDGQAPGTVTEIAAAERLEAFRTEAGAADGMPLQDISFDTIAGAGPNAALPHYRVSRESNRTIQAGEVFLIDSGAQYHDGTTDITRTVAVGNVDEERKEKFTLVLKGMIAVSRARFPIGTRGVDLDPFARAALWAAGCDYNHGTGHGIGSFLAVHEGPQSISKRGFAVLEPGMIVSNEPGYYREGVFGIRIENLILVLPPSDVPGGDKPMHAFETLTFAPIDRRLIVPAMLDENETAWLDGYHASVSETLAPYLDAETNAWLAAATRPLDEGA